MAFRWWVVLSMAVVAALALLGFPALGVLVLGAGGALALLAIIVAIRWAATGRLV